MARLSLGCAAVALTLTAACDDTETAGKSAAESASGAVYALASVVINPDDGDNRTTYVQTLSKLEGSFDNAAAIELPGNGVVLAHGADLFVGAAEEPTWTRYSLRAGGGLDKTGRLSLLDTGSSSIDFGNVIVDDETAVSVMSTSRTAVIWNPTRMEIVDEVDLGLEERDGYTLENWTVSTHDGLVYIPVRWNDWDGQRIYPAVTIVILDPHAHAVLGIAQDERCASGGLVVFGPDGYGYVMGDGRNYAIQMFANATGGLAPDNCLLRIPPKGTAFDPDYHVTIKALTGGLESISELSTAKQGSGLGFAKMFYPSQLPDDMKPVDFDFWEARAHKLWSIELGAEPKAHEVDGMPFSALGFEGSALDGHLYSGASLDSGRTSDVYDVDAQTHSAKKVFSTEGYFYGLYRLR